MAAAHPGTTDRTTVTGQRSNGMAMAAMIVGIISIPAVFVVGVVGLVMAIVAIVLGAIARSNVRRSGMTGGGQALTGIVTGVATIIIFIVAVVFIASNS